MKVVVRQNVIVLIGESEADAPDMEALRSAAGRAFHLLVDPFGTVRLHDLGRREEACREPIDIHSKVADRRLRLISNFAPTPFELDGRAYASVEGFWQSLKFEDAADRARLAAMWGATAKRAADEAVSPVFFTYNGDTLAFGRPEHWALMKRACHAKFSQNEDARAALLSTGDRPLRHRMKRDSRSIPGVVMADIWMAVRATLRDREVRR